MNTALLACTDTDSLSVFDVTDRVTLGIFQRDEGDNQVAFSLIGECFALCWNVLKQRRIIKFHLIASLFESHTKHLFAFNRRGNIVGINLNDIVGTLSFVFQNLDSFGCKARCNNSIADLSL